MRNKVTRQCPQTTTWEEKGEPKQIRTEVPLLTSLTPYLTLGQTCSPPPPPNHHHPHPPNRLTLLSQCMIFTTATNPHTLALAWGASGQENHDTIIITVLLLAGSRVQTCRSEPLAPQSLTCSVTRCGRICSVCREAALAELIRRY